VSVSALPIADAELRSIVVDELGLVEPADYDQAVSTAARRQMPVVRAVAERAGVPYVQLLQHIAGHWAVDYVTLRASDVSPRALMALPEAHARRLSVVPFALEDGKLHVAFRNPRDRQVVAEVQRLVRTPVRPFLADEGAIQKASLLYRPGLQEIFQRAGLGQLPVLLPEQGRPEITPADLLSRLLEYAACAGASDIHIEPFEHETLVRFRIDGVLQEVVVLAPTLATPLVARIKVLSQMRVDEKRAPQDGRMHADLGGLRIELRASSLPTMWGEKMVLRVLANDPILLDLSDLGLSPEDLSLVVRHVLQPHGMVLVTGPTGSGKTTSLYSFLLRVSAERQSVVNISTIEDPIEYTMPRINQVPIRAEAGLDFSNGLRALLRQDPDVIMVGEVRDRETAEMAVRAALVGRLVLSSLHTNDAASAVPRLLDMGVEPYLLASTLSLVIAQRLVRRLCEHCRETRTPPPELLDALKRRDDWEFVLGGLRARGIIGAGQQNLEVLQMFHGRGCERCHGTGYRGRLALFELLAIGDRLRRLTSTRGDAALIKQTALEEGLRPMIVDGLSKVILGLTTPEEVLRATG
jgi:type IV pilus assembly protein PilB